MSDHAYTRCWRNCQLSITHGLPCCLSFLSPIELRSPAEYTTNHQEPLLFINSWHGWWMCDRAIFRAICLFFFQPLMGLLLFLICLVPSSFYTTCLSVKWKKDKKKTQPEGWMMTFVVSTVVVLIVEESEELREKDWRHWRSGRKIWSCQGILSSSSPSH